jgi:VanZ family protein
VWEWLTAWSRSSWAPFYQAALPGRPRCATLARMRRTLHVVWPWVPVVVWVGVIALMSGEIGAQTRSDVWVLRTLHEWLSWLFGTQASSSWAAPTFLPWWVRKLAHVAEYAVLGALAARAFHRSVAPGAWATLRPQPTGCLAGLRAVAVLGLPFCGVVAILDELHQSTLASRTGSPRDVIFDLVGAGLGLAVGWRVFEIQGSGDVPAELSPARPPRGG